MENRLEVQNIQGDELFMELTLEELQELVISPLTLFYYSEKIKYL